MRPSSPTVAVELAERGIPITVIARVCRRDFDEIKQELSEAIERGELAAMPETATVETAKTQAIEDVIRLRLRLGFGPNPAYYVAVLMRRKTLVRYNELILTRPGKIGEAAHSLFVEMSRARKVLRGIGVRVKTVSELGYMMDAENRERLIDFLYHKPPAVDETLPRLGMALRLTKKETETVGLLLDGPIARPPGGTTYLDVHLSNIRQKLRRKNIYIDRIGRPGASQWQFSNDTRRRILAMVKEIKS